MSKVDDNKMGIKNNNRRIRLFAVLSFGVSVSSIFVVEILLHDGVVATRDRALFSIAIIFAALSVVLGFISSTKATSVAHRIFWTLLIIASVCIIALSTYSYLLTYLRWGDTY